MIGSLHYSKKDFSTASSHSPNTYRILTHPLVLSPTQPSTLRVVQPALHHRFTGSLLYLTKAALLHCTCTVHYLCVCVCVLACTSHPRLISIFPPVCRNIAKQTFLETLQDNLIEMDVLASAHRDASFNDGYVARLLSSLLFRQCQPLALSVYACACSPSNSVCVYRTVKFTQTLSKWDVLFGVKH